MRHILVCALLLAPAAQAQIPDHILFAQTSIASDYRFDGLSNSDRHASLEGTLYMWRPDKWFAGATVMGVDNGATYEVDLYGGRNFDVAGTQLTLQGMASLFPDKKDNGVPSYDFLQASIAAKRNVGPLTLGAVVAYTPAASAGAGEAWKVAANASASPARWLTFSGQLGRRDSERGQDRNFWDAGATFFWRDFALDVRYVGTDLTRQQCFFTDWCEDAVVSKLTWHIPNGFPWR